MVQALLVVARWIAAAHDRWCTMTVTRRPLVVELAVLKQRHEKLRAEYELLRARIGRLEPRRRPHYRPWERLSILWHQARHKMTRKRSGGVRVAPLTFACVARNCSMRTRVLSRKRIAPQNGASRLGTRERMVLYDSAVHSRAACFKKVGRKAEKVVSLWGDSP